VIYSLERSEECKQSVVGFKSRCGLASGSQFLQGLLLYEKVGLNVAMRSLNVLMAQPQGDYCDVHSRLGLYAQTPSWYQAERELTANGVVHPMSSF
jgi:hypothetical protein